MFDCTRVPYVVAHWRRDPTHPTKLSCCSAQLSYSTLIRRTPTLVTSCCRRYVCLQEPHALSITDLAAPRLSAQAGAAREEEPDTRAELQVVLQPHRHLSATCFVSRSPDLTGVQAAAAAASPIRSTYGAPWLASGDTVGVIHLFAGTNDTLPPQGEAIPNGGSRHHHPATRSPTATSLPRHQVRGTFYLQAPGELFMTPPLEHPSRSVAQLAQPLHQRDHGFLVAQRQSQLPAHTHAGADSHTSRPDGGSHTIRRRRTEPSSRWCPDTADGTTATLNGFSSRESAEQLGVWALSLEQEMAWPLPIRQHPARLEEQVRLLPIRPATSFFTGSDIGAGSRGFPSTPCSFATITAIAPGRDRCVSLHPSINSPTPVVSFALPPVASCGNTQRDRVVQPWGGAAVSPTRPPVQQQQQVDRVMQGSGYQYWIATTTATATAAHATADGHPPPRVYGGVFLFDIRRSNVPLWQQLLLDEDEAEGDEQESGEGGGASRRRRPQPTEPVPLSKAAEEPIGEKPRTGSSRAGSDITIPLDTAPVGGVEGRDPKTTGKKEDESPTRRDDAPGVLQAPALSPLTGLKRLRLPLGLRRAGRASHPSQQREADTDANEEEEKDPSNDNNGRISSPTSLLLHGVKKETMGDEEYSEEEEEEMEGRRGAVQIESLQDDCFAALSVPPPLRLRRSSTSGRGSTTRLHTYRTALVCEPEGLLSSQVIAHHIFPLKQHLMAEAGALRGDHCEMVYYNGMLHLDGGCGAMLETQYIHSHTILLTTQKRPLSEQASTEVNFKEYWCTAVTSDIRSEIKDHPKFIRNTLGSLCPSLSEQQQNKRNGPSQRRCNAYVSVGAPTSYKWRQDSVVAGSCSSRDVVFSPSAMHRAPSDVSEALAKDLHNIIHHDRLVAFLTGTPTAPRCRFTVQLVDLLEQLAVPYGYFNILTDDEVCEGLKRYSDWPTYPQVFLDGELLGGYDVVQQMMLDGSLPKLLKEKQLLQ
eukprot:gene11879-8165_t